MKDQLMKELSIEKSHKVFKKVYLISVISIIGSVLISLIVWFRSEMRVRDLSKTVIVLDNGIARTGKVSQVNESELKRMQAENVLRIGVDYMYSFSSSNFDERINMAKAYFGNSANEILMSYTNQNVRDKIMQNDLSVDLVIKNIKVVYENNRLVGEIQFEQAFVNGSAIKKRMVAASCTFKDVQPSSLNSSGMVIEDWLIENTSNDGQN